MWSVGAPVVSRRGELQKARSSLGSFKSAQRPGRSKQETAPTPKGGKLLLPIVKILRYSHATPFRACQIHAPIPALNASYLHRRQQRSDIIQAARVEIVFALEPTFLGLLTRCLGSYRRRLLSKARVTANETTRRVDSRDPHDFRAGLPQRGGTSSLSDIETHRGFFLDRVGDFSSLFAQRSETDLRGGNVRRT
jgi:hypothetical protein